MNTRIHLCSTVRTQLLVAMLLLAMTVYAEPGIDSRPENLTCNAPPRPESGPLILGDAFPLHMNRITLGVEIPKGDSSHIYLLHQEGRISRLVNDPSTDQWSTVLDLRPEFEGTTQTGQSGLMDMAFHPDFTSNGELYVAYTVPGDDRTSYLARFVSSDGGASLLAKRRDNSIDPSIQ